MISRSLKHLAVGSEPTATTLGSCMLRQHSWYGHKTIPKEKRETVTSAAPPAETAELCSAEQTKRLPLGDS